MRKLTLFLMPLAVTVSTGCAEKAPAPGSAGASKATSTHAPMAPITNAEPAVPAWPPTRAQPRLKTLKLYLGPEVITAELALSELQVGTGMMFRTSLPEADGMLFVFPRPHRTAFYMKNTTVPLTAAYIDPDGTVLELVDLHPLVEKPVEANFDNVQFVLEMNQGWFKRHNVAPGTLVTTELGPLRKTFGQ